MVAFLGDKRFICGQNVTYPDFLLFELCEFGDWLTEGAIYKQNPTLKEYHGRVKALPRLAEFYTDDSKCIKRPFNGKTAKINN